MTWETFYFVCFVAGLFLSGFSLLGVLGHFGGHLHLPHGTHAPHMPTAGHTMHLPHVGHAPQGAATSTMSQGQSSVGQSSVPWWNAFSIMVFLTWFGATGYLLTRHETFAAIVVLVLSVVAGFAGGAIVFLFLTKVLLPHERELTHEESAVEGVVGRVSAPIRQGGIGEIVYEQLGARRSAPARSEHGAAINKDEEVFVVRYEKGVAWVRRWEDLESSDDSRNR
jgi:hypothetical protein